MLASTSSLKTHNFLLSVALYSTGLGTIGPGKLDICKTEGLHPNRTSYGDSLVVTQVVPYMNRSN